VSQIKEIKIKNYYPMEHLNDFQKNILNECQTHPTGGGLSLPMGSGKSLIALCMAKQTNGKSLIVVSKTLVSVWEFEIKKFFKDTLSTKILFSKDLTTLDFSEKVIITTPETLVKFYKLLDIQGNFIYIDQMTKNYKKPSQPLKKNETSVYSIKWDLLIVDEIQQYTNIKSIRCQSIASLCAKTRWGLSGTIFLEADIARILGYYLILNINGFPRNLPDAEKKVKSKSFAGVFSTLVYRKKNDAFIIPTINEKIVCNDMTVDEKKIYMVMKELMTIINTQVKIFKRRGDVGNMRIFSSYKLAMLTYLRQCIVCPLIPITSAFIDFLDYNKRSDLSCKLIKTIQKHGLNDYINNQDNVKSSRIKSILKNLKEFKDKQVVIFTCFRSSVNILKYYIDELKRPCFTLTGNDNIQKRTNTIKEFEDTSNSVLLLTFKIGSEGLNLQTSHTVFLVNFWWNSGTTSQAIARVLRFGQLSDIVNVYYFTSNTAIEKVVFEKHKGKLQLIESLMHGSMLNEKVKKIKIDDIIKFIEQHENPDLIKNIHNFK
jgi:SNF2 family DNA or RNA helicase